MRQGGGMHLVYLDESGDPGGAGSPTSNYLLGGLAIHHANWGEAHHRLLSFRRSARARHGLKVGAEMHAAEFLGAATTHLGIGRIERLELARGMLDAVVAIPGVRVFGWATDKSGHPLERLAKNVVADLAAWSASGGLPAAKGCEAPGFQLIHDVMGKVPSAWAEAAGGTSMVERSMAQRSDGSLLLQTADFIAYAFRQSLKPNRFMAEHGGRNLVRRLDAVSLGFRWVDGDLTAEK